VVVAEEGAEDKIDKTGEDDEEEEEV